MRFKIMLPAFMLTLATICWAEDKALKSGSGDSWPHWLGPNYNGTSDEKGLLKEWPKDGPKVLWKVPVGVGSNHPAVAGEDVIFAQSDPDFNTESVICLDFTTGKQKWKQTYPTVYPPDKTPDNTNLVGWGKVGVRATPALTDDYAYAMGTLGMVVCIARKTGQLVWTKDLKEKNCGFTGEKGELKKFSQLGEWKGFNISPAISGGKVIFAPHGEPLLLALDGKTGEVAWKYEEAAEKGARPWGIMQLSILKFNNEECCMFHFNYAWKLVRVSDGKLVWSKRVTTTTSNYSNGTIVPLTGNYFLNAPDGLSPGAVECDFGKPDPEPKTLWADIEANDNVVPPAYYNGFIYGFGFEKRSDQWGLGDNPHQTLSLRCTDLKSGKMMWKSKPEFAYGMSISAADGMLYVHSFKKLTLVEANPNAYVEKGRVEPIHNDEFKRGHEQALVDWDMPVIVKKKLLVRTPVDIICYDIADQKSP